MNKIKCNINGTDCEIDESVLEAFEVSTDNENETILNKGWKLYGAIVQNDIHIILKKAATYADASAGKFN